MDNCSDYGGGESERRMGKRNYLETSGVDGGGDAGSFDSEGAVFTRAGKYGLARDKLLTEMSTGGYVHGIEQGSGLSRIGQGRGAKH